MNKAILLFGSAEKFEELTKAHVNAYTRKDGTVVQAHETSRQAAQREPASGLGAHADALRRSSKEGDMDHYTNQHAARLMESGDHEALGSFLRSKDTEARDHILDHVHPDHWEKIGFRPLNKLDAAKKHDEKFGSKPASAPAPASGAAPASASAKPKTKARPAVKKAPEDLGALAEHHESEADRHYNLAKTKGSGHPEHDHHMRVSRLHAQAQYHLEQAKGAENESERSQHMASFNHVKGKIKDVKGELDSDN